MTTKQETLYLRLWIGNLGKYNEGELVGEWFELPCDMSEVAEKIGLNAEYEEYQINDFETNINGLSIHHYDSVDKLNEFAERLNGLDEHEQLILSAYIEEYGIDDVLKDFNTVNFDDVMIFWDCNDMEDVARDYAEQSGLLESIPPDLQNYFDFESYGRDMSYDGTYVFLDNSVCVNFFY